MAKRRNFRARFKDGAVFTRTSATKVYGCCWRVWINYDLAAFKYSTKTGRNVVDSGWASTLELGQRAAQTVANRYKHCEPVVEIAPANVIGGEPIDAPADLPHHKHKFTSAEFVASFAA